MNCCSRKNGLVAGKLSLLAVAFVLVSFSQASAGDSYGRSYSGYSAYGRSYHAPYAKQPACSQSYSGGSHSAYRYRSQATYPKYHATPYYGVSKAYRRHY